MSLGLSLISHPQPTLQNWTLFLIDKIGNMHYSDVGFDIFSPEASGMFRTMADHLYIGNQQIGRIRLQADLPADGLLAAKLIDQLKATTGTSDWAVLRLDGQMRISISYSSENLEKNGGVDGLVKLINELISNSSF